PGVLAAASLRGTSLGYRIHKSSTPPPLQISIDSPGKKKNHRRTLEPCLLLLRMLLLYEIGYEFLMAEVLYEIGYEFLMAEGYFI
ncbi:hypothetical protein KSS87_012384, partial [Heliosperma pusillum]